MSDFSLDEFLSLYGTDVQCLQAVFDLKYANYQCACGNNKFYPLSSRTSYVCGRCGHHLYPLAGTIFHRSRTPLHLWFYAMYLMTATRSGISAKQLQRQLGVTYKTAWRIGHQIRLLMASGEDMLEGVVQVDETFWGPRGRHRYYEWYANRPKQVIMGMLEPSGRVKVKHVANTGAGTLIGQIEKSVKKGSTIHSDELWAYRALSHKGYVHTSICHSAHQYHRDYCSTQTIESLWSNLKRGLTGVYRYVSPTYLERYAIEYAFRFEHRKKNGFACLLSRVERPLFSPLPATGLPRTESGVKDYLSEIW